MAISRWRRRFDGNMRVDLPDFRTMMDRAYADFNLLVQSFMDNEVKPRVLRRYFEGTHAANTFKIRKDVQRAILDSKQEWFYANKDAAGQTFDLTLQQGSTNYIQVKIKFLNDDLQTRAFWDTDIGLTGQEFFDEINVRTRLDEEFSVNQTGFSGGDWIPLFEADTDGAGLVTAVRRKDDFFWAARKLTLPSNANRSDVYLGQVKDLRSFIDFLGSITGEMKATGAKIEDASWSNIKLLREYQNLFYTGGGNIEFEGTLGADKISWDAAIEIILAGRADVFTLPTPGAPIDILDGEAIYVSIPESVSTGADEIQRLTFSDLPASGSFKLKFGANTTPALPFNASQATIQAALEALLSIGVGNIIVSGDPSTLIIDFTFTSALSATDVALIEVVDNVLLDASSAVITDYIETTQEGAAPTTGTLIPIVAPLSAVPVNPLSGGFDPKIQVLFTRRGTTIYGNMDIPEISSGEVVIIGQNLSNNTKNRLGLTSDTTFQAYGSTTIIAANDNYATAISKLDLAVTTGLGAGAALTNQDRSLKLVRGGLWAVTEPVIGTLRLTNALSAFVQINGLAEDRNEIAAQNLDFTADGQCAYVSIARATPGVAAALTVTITDIATVPNAANTFIIARRVNGRINVGSLAIIKGEFRSLDFGLSENNKSLIGGAVNPIDESTASAQWAARTAPLRNIQSTDSTLDAIASLDKELDKFFGQLRITAHPTDVFKAVVTGVDRTMLDGSILSQEMKNLVMDFDGAVINFTTGVITKADGLTALGQNFTPFTIPVGEYFWYGVGIIPGSVNANNTIAAQVLITPASTSNAVAANASVAAVGGTKKIGLIRIFNNAGVVESHQIRQFGTGSGGGGSGSGNANDFYIELKRRLDQSLFGWFTSNIALDDEDELIDVPGSTATYDIANNVFNFSLVGSVLKSIQQYGSSFLESFNDHVAVELQALWNTNDDLATYEVSRDGGLNWLTLAMERVGASKHYVGSGNFIDPVVTETLVQYPTAVTPVNVDMNTTVLKRAVKVVVTEKSKYQSVVLKYNKTGSPLGLFTLSWVKNNGGVPSTDLLASANIAVSDLLVGPNNLTVSVPTILPPGTYWLVIEGDATYRSSYANGVTEVELQADSAGTYAGGLSYEFDGTTWTATASTQILFGTIGFRYNLLVRITSGTLGSSLEGYGVFFGEEGGAVETNVEEPQYFRFSGSLDQTDFVVTNFWPNPKRVRATFVNAGLTFIHPFFDVIGNTLKFQSGTFLYPGMDLIVKIENTELGGSANVDLAKINSLLAENGLGSENNTLDLSTAGKGIKIRRPDGVLRMIRLDNNDDLIVESLP